MSRFQNIFQRNGLDHENVTRSREGVGQMCIVWNRRGIPKRFMLPMRHCNDNGDSGHQYSEVVCLEDSSCNASITQDASPYRTHKKGPWVCQHPTATSLRCNYLTRLQQRSRALRRRCMGSQDSRMREGWRNRWGS